MEKTSDVYHEKQSLKLCAVHAVNNLLQSQGSFTKKQFDGICCQYVNLLIGIDRVTMTSFDKYYLCSLLPPCCGSILCNVDMMKSLEFCLLTAVLGNMLSVKYLYLYKTSRNDNAFNTHNMVL